MDSNLLKTKSIERLVDDVEHGTRHLKRALSAFDLTLLGVGAIIGTGIFVLTGTAAANQAGPAVTVSYVLAGIACAFAALCYAEFAAMIPISGSAYTYAYATLGEVFAWMIGWDLILEYAVGAIAVSIGWSGYLQNLLAGVGIHLPVWMSAAPGSMPGALLNLPAVLVVLALTGLLVLGIRESARINAVAVTVKIVAVLFFIAAGSTFVRPENWSPFAPYGWSGIVSAGAVVFFSYIGFDAISTTAEEVKNPKRDLPIGIITSLVICTLLYLSVAAILTGIVPVTAYRSIPDALASPAVVSPELRTQFVNAPVAFALTHIHQDWAAGLISAGAVAGITSVLLVLLLSQPRIFFAMSRDRLLPERVSRIHERFGTPHITTMITGFVVAAVAGFARLDVAGEMVSIGTLFAFIVVCSAVVVLRLKRPDAKRPFRVPGGHTLPVLGVLSCLYLMVNLSVITWVRFLVWLDLGMLIYWFYGRTHSPLSDPAERAAQGLGTKCGNLLKVMGGLALFNGIAITFLAYLTEVGVTTETTAKWHEIRVEPTQADVVGLVVVGTSLAMLATGWLVGRIPSPKKA